MTDVYPFPQPPEPRERTTPTSLLLIIVVVAVVFLILGVSPFLYGWYSCSVDGDGVRYHYDVIRGCTYDQSREDHA